MRQTQQQKEDEKKKKEMENFKGGKNPQSSTLSKALSKPSASTKTEKNYLKEIEDRARDLMDVSFTKCRPKDIDFESLYRDKLPDEAIELQEFVKTQIKNNSGPDDERSAEIIIKNKESLRKI